ncbi:hypothetical protein QV09_05510 [Gallibacterium salpingitidis]|uniref:Phage protein n=1 Tax=Gallibacterium salpingitidis TaxID=505341 RepID=A0AB36E2D8_9PAST|nr:DUF4054 domain-containing protein [Gallibacterium salpingitidis]OBX10408.1 hypothetical protein QV09_05510 [Gallibacterium salpingitidis]WKT00528.1 DUF4054 domain-containing protein [Gallibacterium salpingitidis]
MDIAVFKKMFPVFNEIDDETITLWEDTANTFLKESWALSGKTFEHAQRLLTAHLLHLAVKCNSGESNSATGLVASATQGSVSVSFTTPTTSNGWQYWLSTSPYGLQLWALLKQLSASGFYIGGLPERRSVRKVGGVWL